LQGETRLLLGPGDRLKITPKKEKKKIKEYMAKVMGSFRGSHVPSWLSAPQTDVPA
jgi:hypothetical protein